MFVQLTLAVSVLAAGEDQEDSDLQSRGPYEFQFRVDDPETFNNYEVSLFLNLIMFNEHIDFQDPRGRGPQHSNWELQDQPA